MRKYSVSCSSFAIVNLKLCTIMNPGKSFFYSDLESFITINDSQLKQSNPSLPISLIKRNGKLSIQDSCIEWDRTLNYSYTFGESSFAQLKKVRINQDTILDYLFRKNNWTISSFVNVENNEYLAFKIGINNFLIFIQNWYQRMFSQLPKILVLSNATCLRLPKEMMKLTSFNFF
jgi:hypothetical protein